MADIKNFDEAAIALPMWKKLYDLAEHIKTLNPWEWMDAGDVLGVRLFDSTDIWFATFLEWKDGIKSCSLFKGQKAWRDGLVLSLDDPIKMLETTQLRLAYLSREHLKPYELDILLRLGLKYSGKHVWPVFRSYLVGYLPAMINAGEAKQMVEMLRQVFGVALRVENDRQLLRQTRMEKKFLVRVQDGAGKWRDEWQELPPLRTREFSVEVDIGKVKRILDGGMQDCCLQIDLGRAPGTITPPGQGRRQLVYMLMVVDADSGIVHTGELMETIAGVEAMWALVPEAILSTFLNLGWYPREIEVANEWMANMMRPLGELIPFRMTRRRHLESLEQARHGFYEYLRNRKL